MTAATPDRPAGFTPRLSRMEDGLRRAVMLGDLDWLRADTTPHAWNDPQGEALGRLEVFDRMASVDREKNTPWLLAAHHGHLDAMELLAPWSDVQARNHKQQDALMRAAASGKVPVVRALLERWGADPHQQDRNGWTALMHAAAEGEPGTLDVLLPVSDPLTVSAREGGNTALLLAAKHQHTACVERLLPVSDVHRPCGITWTEGEDPWPFPLTVPSPAHTRRGHRTPLMWAANGGPLAMLAMLIPVSDHAATDSLGRTAFDQALSGQHWEHLDRLAFHADPDRVARAFHHHAARLPAWAAHQERQALHAALHNGNLEPPHATAADEPPRSVARPRL